MLGRYHALVAINTRLPHGELHAKHHSVLAILEPLIERGQRDGSFRCDVPAAWHLSMILALVHAASAELRAGRLPDQRAPLFANPCECRTVVRMSVDRDTCELLCLDLPKAESLRRELPAADALEAAATQLKALTDPTRLALLLALRHGESCCVCDLGWIVGRDEKLVSHHVRLLKSLGVVRSRRDGRMVMYELTEAGRVLVDAFSGTRAVSAG
jgi:DNA-binding transcriptional ArsR family regulator